jgi:hypothetical protein
MPSSFTANSQMSHHFFRACVNSFLLAQLPITILTMLYFPEPVTSVLWTVVYNSSMKSTDSVDVDVEEFHMSSLYFFTSVCVFFFGFTTKNQYSFDMETKYDANSDIPISMWNVIFWVCAFMGHVVLVAHLLCPCEWSLLVFVLFGTLEVMMRIVGLPLRSVQNRTEENMLVLVFVVLIFIMYHNMHLKHGKDLLVFLCLMTCDCLLLVGHIYDKEMTLEAIGNCRLYYVGFIISIMLVLYVSV